MEPVQIGPTYRTPDHEQKGPSEIDDREHR
jgi:hypothetical protein